MSEDLTKELILALKSVTQLGSKIDSNSILLAEIRKDLDKIMESRGVDAISIARLQRDLVSLEKEIDEMKQEARSRGEGETRKLATLGAAVTALSTVIASLVQKLGPVAGS